MSRTKQVRFYLLFNFHLMFTNKSLGSLWCACCQEKFVTNIYPTSLLRLGFTLCVWPSLGDHWGCFASVRTYWPDHSCPNENFTFNQNYSVRHILNSMHEGDGFSAKPLRKSQCHCQNDQSSHGPASQFWVWESTLSVGLSWLRVFLWCGSAHLQWL